MRRINKCVIVAAGCSSRLRPLTQDLPKSLLDIGGERIIERAVRLLRKNGIAEIGIVVGFEHEKIQDCLGHDGITYFYNPFYKYTNNLASLWLVKNWVDKECFLHLHSDVVFHEALLQKIINCETENSAMLVGFGPTDEEAMKVRGAGTRFIESNKLIKPEEASGELVGMSVIKEQDVASLFTTIEEVLAEHQLNAYDTEAFSRMARRGINFELVPTDDWAWIEVDFPADLLQAREMFKVVGSI